MSSYGGINSGNNFFLRNYQFCFWIYCGWFGFGVLLPWNQVFDSRCLKPGVWSQVFETRFLEPGVWNQVSETRSLKPGVLIRYLSPDVWNQVFKTSCLKPGVKLVKRVKPRRYNSFWRNTVLLKGILIFLQFNQNSCLLWGWFGWLVLGCFYLETRCLKAGDWNRCLNSNVRTQEFALKCLNPGVWT